MTKVQSRERNPMIVGLGGTSRPSSSTERALRRALEVAVDRGATVEIFDGPFLAALPVYNPVVPERTADERRLVDAVRKADAIIVATPGYHGGVAGFIKNALDLLEETANDERVYFSRIPVGLIVTAYGWQATGSTLAALRGVVHAMRGWPTPLGVAINSKEVSFDELGRCSDPRVEGQLVAMVEDMIWFTSGRSGSH